MGRRTRKGKRYFIGYSRSPRTIELMLENMFIGRPPGNYDRLLDFSRAVTGSLFFAPAADFLETGHVEGTAEIAAVRERAPVESRLSSPRQNDGSLRIGSLKGENLR